MSVPADLIVQVLVAVLTGAVAGIVAGVTAVATLRSDVRWLIDRVTALEEYLGLRGPQRVEPPPDYANRS
jgi:uncharacterized coiled-coil protein SlyX